MKQAGFNPWLDAESLLPGQRRDVEIRRAIRESRFFLVLLSSHSIKRGKVNREVARALEAFDEFSESDVFIIPVRLDECEPSHEKLGGLVMTDLFPDWDTGFERILLAIRAAENGEMNSGGENTGGDDTGGDNNRSAAENAGESGTPSPPSDASHSSGSADANHTETIDKNTISSGENNKPASLVPAFAVLLILIGAVVGTGFLSKGALFHLVEQYSRDFSVFAVYAGFAFISLIVAVVLFGIVRSTGVFKKTGKKEQFEFGGAMAGFLVTLMFLITSYSMHTSAPVFLEIKGNVRFMQEGKAVGPVFGATVSVSGISGHRGETDKDGNFILKLPKDQQVQAIELLVKHKTGSFYHTVQRGDAGRVVIGIDVKDEGGDRASETGKGASGDVKTEGDKSPAIVSGGDVTVNY